MSELSPHLSRADERCAAVIFFAFGLSSLSVFNTLTVPGDLWNRRLGSSEFMFRFPTFYNSTYLVVQFINLFWLFHLPSGWRLTPGIVINCLLTLYAMLVFPLVPQDSLKIGLDVFFGLSVVAGLLNSVFQGAIFSAASAIGSQGVFSSMMAGQGLAGLLPAIVRMSQTLYETLTKRPISDTTWMIYFGLGQLSTLPAVVCLILLYRRPALRAVMRQLRAKEYWGIVPPVATPPLLAVDTPSTGIDVSSDGPLDDSPYVPQIPRETQLERENAAYAVESPRAPAPTPASTGRPPALTPVATHDVPAPIEPRLTAGQALRKTFVGLLRALRTCWAEALALFCIFTFTLAVYPGVISSFRPSSPPFTPIHAWWTTLSLFWFLLSDYIGRQMASFKWAIPKARGVVVAMHVLVYLRIPICLVLFWFCFSPPSVGIDVLQALTTFTIFGFANGYLSTLMVTLGPTHSHDPVQRNMAGAWCSLALNSGLTVGGFLTPLAKHLIH